MKHTLEEYEQAFEEWYPNFVDYYCAEHKQVMRLKEQIESNLLIKSFAKAIICKYLPIIEEVQKDKFDNT